MKPVDVKVVNDVYERDGKIFMTTKGWLVDGKFTPIVTEEVLNFLKTNGGQIEQAVPFSQLLQKARDLKKEILKKIRDEKVKNIVVTLDSGEVLNGDEDSQTRFTRAINGLFDDKTEISWIGADNKIYKLTRPKLKEALVKAGSVQTQIYIAYAALKEKLARAKTLQEISNIEWK